MIKQEAKVYRIKQHIEQLQTELAGLVEVSTTLKQITEQAKTHPKKQHYTKKLKKNNQKIVSLLSTLDRYNTIYSNSQE